MADNADSFTYDYDYDRNDTNTMEPPTKRPRLSVPSDPPEQDEEVSEDWDLQTARAQNDMKLKSIFEGIFAKYGQDFTEVGDEIDLETGDIVIDNGHLLGLQEEGRGNQNQAWNPEDDAESENEEEPAGPQPQADALVFEDPEKHSDGSLQALQPDSNEPRANEEQSDSRESALTSTSGNPKAGPVPDQLDLKPPPPHEELGPTDPVWKVPELPRPASTPKTETRFTKAPITPRLPAIDRKSSPPGSRSLWSVPRPRRPRTEGKPRATPSKTRPRAKRKYHSSPVALEALDWSFADIAEGDESDDPLQEHQPSPTPSKTANIRRKRMRITKEEPSHLGNQVDVKYELPTSAESAPQDQSATATHFDAEHSHVEQGDAQATVANTIDLECHLAVHPTDMQYAAAPALAAVPVPVPAPAPISAPVSAYAPTLSSPKSTTPRTRNEMTPDEMKLVLRMRYVEKKRMKEILRFLPKWTLSSLHQWNSNHWLAARSNPSPLQAPWSEDELNTLDRLQDQPFLIWKDMQAELPTRSKAEIEFELMRRWVGEEVWNDEGSILPHRLKKDDVVQGHCDSPQRRDRSTTEDRCDTPQTQDHGSENEVHGQQATVTPVKHLETPSASQTPTVYLISDGENEEDEEDEQAEESEREDQDMEDTATLSDGADDHIKETSQDPQPLEMHASFFGARPRRGFAWSPLRPSDSRAPPKLDN